MSLRELLDHQEREAVVAEPTEDGRLRLQALSKDRPLTAETRELCAQNKRTLLAYAKFAQKADRLLLESTRRIAAGWPEVCASLEADAAWDDLEAELHRAYWSMDWQRFMCSRRAVSTEPTCGLMNPPTPWNWNPTGCSKRRFVS